MESAGRSRPSRNGSGIVYGLVSFTYLLEHLNKPFSSLKYIYIYILHIFIIFILGNFFFLSQIVTFSIPSLHSFLLRHRNEINFQILIFYPDPLVVSIILMQIFWGFFSLQEIITIVPTKFCFFRFKACRIFFLPDCIDQDLQYNVEQKWK